MNGSHLLALGILIVFVAYILQTRVTYRKYGQALVDLSVQRAVILALLGACEPYHDNPELAAVIKYARDALTRLDQTDRTT